MNFDAILSSSNIVVDAKICKDNEKDKDKDKECGIPIITKEKKEKAVDKTADKIATPEKAIDKAEKQDDVNIVIKSCKNITSKQALLIIPITKFFSNREVLNKLITILKGESISLRLIDWFVTNYCKNFNLMYNLNDYRYLQIQNSLH